MNNYPSWWDDDISLYNKFTDIQTKRVRWYRTTLNECFYRHTVDKITLGNTTLSSNSSVCRIRVDDRFISRDKWIKLSDEEKEEHFTLGVGDIIVAGNVEFEVDEYTNGKRSSDLIKEYSEWPGCFTIEVVNINVGGGVGNEHYHVKGT